MSAGAGTVTLERPATLTLGNGTVLTSNMTPEQRSAAVRGSMGLPAVPRPTAEPFGPPGPTAYRDQQVATREGAGAIAQAPQPVEEVNRWFRQLPADKRDSMRGEYHARLVAAIDGQPLAKANPDGTVSVSAHAGMVTPSPEELAAANSGNNNLAEFEREMREKGAMLPAPVEDGRFQRDERTGHLVDTAALEKCHELYRSIKDPAEREAARQEYHETLDAIYRGELQLADMEGSDAPRVEQPRDAQGRFAPSPASIKPETGSWQQQHVEDGQWVDIGRLTTADTHGYTIPRYIPDQRLNVSTFELLKSARAAGITQEQVNAVFHQDAIKNGWRKA